MSYMECVELPECDDRTSVVSLVSGLPFQPNKRWLPPTFTLPFDGQPSISMMPEKSRPPCPPFANA